MGNAGVRGSHKQMGSTATVAKALVRPEYSKYVEMDIEGLEAINDMRAQKHRESRSYEPPSRIVGQFGIMDPSRKGAKYLVNWKITGGRKDKRHGAIGKPVPISRYGKHLLEAMFKGW